MLQVQSIGQHRVCFNERSFGPPLHLQARQDNYDYDCSCLLLPAFPRESCLLSSIRCCGGTFFADHNRTRSLVSIKDGTPAFPFISAIILLTTPTQTVDRLTCRGQCLISIHTVATLFHYNSTARRRLNHKTQPTWRRHPQPRDSKDSTLISTTLFLLLESARQNPETPLPAPSSLTHSLTYPRTQYCRQ